MFRSLRSSPTRRVPGAEAAGTRPAVLLALAALAVHLVWLVRGTLAVSFEPHDFLLIYLGSRHALEGNLPYGNEVMERLLAEFFRGERSVVPIFGSFFYPPGAVLMLAPLAPVPWEVARAVWVGLLSLAMVATAYLVLHLRPGRSAPLLAVVVLGAAFLVNPLTERTIALGQTTPLLCVLLAAGQWCFLRGRTKAGVLLWSLAAFKPHLVIPFWLASAVNGGWKRLRDLILVTGALNVVGSVVMSGGLDALIAFLTVPGDYRVFELNTVLSDQIISWNRLLYVLAGIRVDLSPLGMLLGYALWSVLLLVRVARERGNRPTPEFTLAYAAAGALLFAQGHGYDLLLLTLAAPYAVQLWRAGYWKDVWFLGLVSLAAVPPRGAVARVLEVLSIGGTSHELLLSYRSIVALLIGLYLVVRYQPRRVSQWKASGGKLEHSYPETGAHPQISVR